MIEEFGDEQLVDELIKRHTAKGKAMMIVRQPDDDGILMRQSWTGCSYTIVGMARQMEKTMNQVIEANEGEIEPRD